MEKQNLFLIIGVLIFSNLNGMYSGTLVQLKKRQFKRAHQLKLGDEVLSFYAKKNKSGYSKIKKINEKVSDKIIIIETNNGKIFTNPELKFFNPELGKFVAACNLKVGNKLMGLNLEIYKIVKITTVNRKFKTYSITIGKPHIYFIYDSKKCSILVHNENEDIAIKILEILPAISGIGKATAVAYNITVVEAGGTAIVGAGAAEAATTGGAVVAASGPPGWVIGGVVALVLVGGYFTWWYFFKSPDEPRVSYYNLFGIKKTATLHEIESKYRFLMLEPFIDDSLRRVLIEAYRCLSNEETRRKYDKCFKSKKFDDFHNLLNKETIEHMEKFIAERNR